MKKTKQLSPLLEFHEKSLIEGEMEYSGLCCQIPNLGPDYIDTLSLIDPRKGENWNSYPVYWGFDGETDVNAKIDYWSKRNYDVMRKYTPLRQTIVLLIAAIHGEL